MKSSMIKHDICTAVQSEAAESGGPIGQKGHFCIQLKSNDFYVVHEPNTNF